MVSSGGLAIALAVTKFLLSKEFPPIAAGELVNKESASDFSSFFDNFWVGSTGPRLGLRSAEKNPSVLIDRFEGYSLKSICL